MLSKLHKQLALFSTIVISLIILTITLIYLYISEDSIRKNYEDSFSTTYRALNSAISKGSLHSGISHRFITGLEKPNGYYIHIVDNDRVYLSESLQKSYKSRKHLYDAAEQAALDLQTFKFGDFPPNQYNSVISRQLHTTIDDVEYRIYIAQITDGENYMGYILLAPLHVLEKRITRQRLQFLAIYIVSLIIIYVFAYLFIGHMMKPIRENRKRQSQFIASASHELRTPLAVILSSLSALEIASGDDAVQFRKAIHSEGQRMSRLVDDLLLYSSTESHTIHLNMEQIQPDTLLISTYEKYYPLLSQQNIDLHIQLPDDTIPNILCDLQRMEQVFSIFINNALSYAMSGNYLELKLTHDNRYVEFRVIDKGPGISDENKKLIFNHFHRIDTSHASRSHFGLGLGIARELVHLQHGKIWVEDTIPNGCTFVVRLKADKGE